MEEISGSSGHWLLSSRKHAAAGSGILPSGATERPHIVLDGLGAACFTLRFCMFVVHTHA